MNMTEVDDRYGPSTTEVAVLIERVKTLTPDEAERLSATWTAARSAAWNAARSATWSGAREDAWDAAWSAAWDATWSDVRVAAWDATWSAAWDTARSAALALVVRDLITSDQFDILYDPWASVINND